jgi:hypothetical protein
MDQLINYKHRNDFVISEGTSDTSSIQQIQTTDKRKRKLKILCNECNQKREFLDESHQVCHICYKAKTVYKPSRNKVIDDFIRHTLTYGNKITGRMEFVPYNRFKDIEFLAEGGFSKVYKATWIDGPFHKWSYKTQSYIRANRNCEVVLKKLNNSKEITSKELNEVNDINIINKS